MSYRNDLIDELENLPAERAAARPSKAKDFHPPLEVDFDKAHAYMANHRKMMQAETQGIAQRDQFDTATREMKGSLRRQIEALPEVVFAKTKMEQEVETRASRGIGLVAMGQGYGAPTFMSKANRTEADERATERARQALTKIEKLAFVAGDFQAAVDAVWNELHAADAADRWVSSPSIEKPLPPRERQGLAYLNGKLVPDGYATGVPANPNQAEDYSKIAPVAAGVRVTEGFGDDEIIVDASQLQ